MVTRIPSLRPTEPAPPFSEWPIQHADPDVGFAWYVGNGAIVTQVCATVGTARCATVVSDWIDKLLEAHGTDISNAGGLLGIHDWRRIQKYESEARTIWFARILRRPKGYLRKAVVITADNPLLRMAIAGGNLLMAVKRSSEARIETATNAYEVLRAYEIPIPTR